ncbi:hypothetical protein CH333_02475 [candidate division WOR-3 bacterium JGI_Cruoil_03_44_89]|uniref:RAMA domain-containing protein n=1 Tax=candidate division WOR-3 bacterium JGI_Cruoil_03_44_89 TaxID=1973748 RepID=A0A235BXB2_UNCW3|nr:MAG: hypothetical protein CH333_02475 [candidate division WOR-3 bacterium JGI_Cruoil_03_44_89]
MEEERILIDGIKYNLWAPEDEVREFEPIVVEHITDILGSTNAIFFTKQKIRTPRGIGSIPDGFAIVLDNTPHWYVIEVELSRHSPYDHAEPQAKKFKKAIQSSETRKQLVDAMYDEVKSDIIKEKLIKDKIGSGEIHKFLSDLITIDNLTLLIVLEEVTEDWREAFDDFPNVEIVEFKTFKREDAPTVHAHLFKPLFAPLSIRKKLGENETIIKEGDVVKLKGERPPDVSEWSWSRVWGQERRVKEVSGDEALLIIDEKTRGFWFPLKCLEKVGVALSEKEIQGPTKTSEWTKDELIEFLGHRTDIQRAFLRTLAERDKVYNDDLLAELKRKLRDKFDGYTSGALGGLSRAIKLAGKGYLHYHECDDKGEYYKIVEKYRDMIKRYFSQQE